MKTPFFAALLFSVSFNLRAQTASSGPTSPVQAQDTPYAAVQRDANSRVWERTIYEPGPSGEAVPQEHHYTELATGLNHLVNGEWVESKEEIDILPDGTAQAVQGQHQAYFPGDIYEGQIELDAPDGQQLKSRPMGLSYFDGQNSVLIATLTNSIGLVVGSNHVIYPNAFTGFKADLMYTYTKAGFEQDVILREQPPTPDSFGLDPQTTRLQVLTEFFNPLQPSIQPMPALTQAGLSLADESLGFGTMQMVPGRAFLLGDNAAEAAAKVSKSWLLLNGRQFLEEEVPVNAIAQGLTTLPSVAINSSKNRHLAARHLILPPQHFARTNPSKTMRLAKADLPRHGFVLDYQTINNNLTNYTFQGDTTYYISGTISLGGTNTFEGGAVFKYASGGSLYANHATFNWLASAYRPVVFTAIDDNSVGETISGSTGIPTNYYAAYALNFYQANASISYFRIAYAQKGLSPNYGSNTFANGQLVNCQVGIENYSDTLKVRNVLFANVQAGFNAIANGAVDVQNSTFGGSSILASNISNGSLSLENCILANVTQLTNSISSSIFTGTNNGFYNSPAFGANIITNAFYPFQSVGAGSYYLTNGCSFVTAGTTNIDGALLAELREKTSYPPIVYSNLTISTNLILGPQAVLDTNALPDLGYHYDPLDHCFGGVVVNSNISFTAGTAVGWFELPGSGGPGFGIRLAGAGSASFNGTATVPCTFARYSVVQEGGNGLWGDKGWLAGVTSAQTNPGAVNAAAQFTHFAELAADPNDFAEYYEPLYLNANHCEFWSGISEGYWMHQYFTNCLFDRVSVGIHGNYASLLAMRNCTMHGGQLYGQHSGGTWQVWIENCAFDSSTNFMDDNSSGNTNITYCDFNGFLNGAQRLVVLGAHDVLTNAFNWQSSPSRNWNFYQPTNSPMIDKGSVAANIIGLYNFTTATNQQEEANSQVDIGYHYIALDGNGNILDNDSDGVPDWEDADPNNPNVGILSITIVSPSQGAIIQ